MISAIRRFLTAYAAVKTERIRRESAIDHVIAHPTQFLGQHIDQIISRCGQPDRFSSFDFGKGEAEWDGRHPTRLRVFLRDGAYVEEIE
ncbi:hypothetical protein PI87_06520 [Ralstonia sp. A12]|uniref:hypothetical protein n=1 Tax=Ralstonia sp. A12 TaxID=1217052 RepID=UPI0005738FCB|nr:hypothetical protein [Ralstonia sp. A12]KHK58058.1 hypothetical protein PI87_06520 [Ralstonia sp. A12]